MELDKLDRAFFFRRFFEELRNLRARNVFISTKEYDYFYTYINAIANLTCKPTYDQMIMCSDADFYHKLYEFMTAIETLIATKADPSKINNLCNILRGIIKK